MLAWAIPESDLRATVDALAGRGVEVLRFEDFEHDDCGIWAARGRDRVVWFSDPELELVAKHGRDWAGHRSELKAGAAWCEAHADVCGDGYSSRRKRCSSTRIVERSN